MKILLTGASGFVGTNLAKNFRMTNINIGELSLRNSFWKEKIDKNATAIIHLAGRSHDSKNLTGSNKYFKINTDLTIELFDQFLQSDCRDFIFFSSIKAVADHQEFGEVNEDTLPDPQSAYGQSKLLAEQYILSKSLPSNKRVFILRPAMIHGPGNKGNLNLLFKLVSKRIPWPLGAFQNRRSFCSIDNVFYVIKELIVRDDIPSGIYNLADDEVLSTNDLIRLIGSEIGIKSHIVKIPKWMIKIISKFGDLLRLPLNTERLEKLTESFVVSNDKLKATLGIREFPISSTEGLKKTILSFRSKKKVI